MWRGSFLEEPDCVEGVYLMCYYWWGFFKDDLHHKGSSKELYKPIKNLHKYKYWRFGRFSWLLFPQSCIIPRPNSICWRLQVKNLELEDESLPTSAARSSSPFEARGSGLRLRLNWLRSSFDKDLTVHCESDKCYRSAMVNRWFSFKELGGNKAYFDLQHQLGLCWEWQGRCCVVWGTFQRDG